MSVFCGVANRGVKHGDKSLGPPRFDCNGLNYGFATSVKFVFPDDLHAPRFCAIIRLSNEVERGGCSMH